MTKTKTAQPNRDLRDPRVPLNVPQFGAPPLAKQCRACGLWFPWKAFIAGGECSVPSGRGAVSNRVVARSECLRCSSPKGRG
jgi:hypothetical protein